MSAVWEHARLVLGSDAGHDSQALVQNYRCFCSVQEVHAEFGELRDCVCPEAGKQRTNVTRLRAIPRGQAVSLSGKGVSRGLAPGCYIPRPMSTVKTIAVIGAGTMGSGIALTAAQTGFNAIQIDVSQAALDKAKAGHAKSLARLVEKGKMQQADADAALKRVSYCTAMADAKAADWVVEAATENVELKKKIFKEMQATFREDVVLATNTSSISITDIASSVGKDAPRVIGMHFFNPVPIMKLVEVIKGIATSEETTARTIELSKAMGKTPVPANDRAGFVSNRVLMPMINEAFYAWMEGVAKPEDIDQIMLLGCNFPMGPLRLADFIGLDVCHDIMMVLHKELGNPKFFPCPLLRQLVQAGRLGDKTGRGVYEYPAK